MFKNKPTDFYQFEFLRVLGTAPTHGCDVGECVEAASKIRDGDGESWHRAWGEAAVKAELDAEKAIQIGDKLAARWAFLRASNYWRSSELMLRTVVPKHDPRQLDSMSRSVDNHKKACRLFDTPVKFLKIPFGCDESEHLPAYLYFPTNYLNSSQPELDTRNGMTDSTSYIRDAKIPVVVQVQGYDTTQEEMYHFTVAGALPRGYAVLTFDGPGQGMVIRRGGQKDNTAKRLYMRHDSEVVIKAVLDALWAFSVSPSYPTTYRQLDLDGGVALVGNSLGALFALRGAAMESSPRLVSKIFDGEDDQHFSSTEKSNHQNHIHPLRPQNGRVKACVALDGFYDLGAPARAHIPSLLRREFKSPLSRRFVNWVVRTALKLTPNPRERWEACHGIYVLGAVTPLEAVAKLQDFTLDNRKTGRSMLEDVKCPTMVSDALDSLFPIEAQRIYDALSGLVDGETKKMWRPEGIGQGSLQAKVAAFSKMHAVVFGWLDEVFQVQKGGSVDAAELEEVVSSGVELDGFKGECRVSCTSTSGS